MNSEATLSDALSEVDAALAASDNERAAGLASELLLAYPNAVTALRQRARALTAAGRLLQAAEVQRRVLEILPADGEAMAGLARALHVAGQHAEAREAARQALDYFPSDEALQRIAASEGLPFQAGQTSMHLFRARVHAQAGLNNRAAAGLRSVIAKWPERTDVKIALMQTLWRKAARIAAAEQAQAVLDEYPYCLNAHLLMLELWRGAGASDMERVHLQAIEQVDPDHRATHAMLGTQSPLPVKDVPAQPTQPVEPATTDEDPLAREAWVDSLMAESSALPKPLERHSATADDTADVAVEDDSVHVEAEADAPAEYISSLLPLEWSAADDFSEAPAQDDFGVAWIDGNAKETFSPARPRAAQPDPNDGVPAELPALEWESAGDESVPQQDSQAEVDGDAVSTELPPSAGMPDTATSAHDAGAVSETPTTAAEGQAAPTPAPAEQAPNIVSTQLPDSALQQDQVEVQAEQVLQGEAQPAMPQLAPAQETPAPASEVSATAIAQTAPAHTAKDAAAEQSVVGEQAGDAQEASVFKAVAAVTAIGTTAKRRAKRAAVEKAAPAEIPTSAQPVTPVTLAVEPPAAARTAAEPAVVEPPHAKGKAKQESAGKAVKQKPAKKPVSKPATLETQTEKVRKTYERAVATAKRENLPKLIKELNQAAERDPDNKIIFELLGQAYNRSGDIPAAINAYRKALELAEAA